MLTSKSHGLRLRSTFVGLSYAVGATRAVLRDAASLSSNSDFLRYFLENSGHMRWHADPTMKVEGIAILLRG